MTTIAGLPVTGTLPVGGPPPSSGLRDLLDRVVGLASPGGLLMRAAQPVLADALRRSGAGAGTEWGPSLQRVLDDPRSVAAFQAGMAEGALGGAKAMVGGLWDLTKGVARAAYDTGPLGWAVEGAQRLGVLGEVPGWAPDAGRVTERAAAIGGAVGEYAAAVGRNPAKLGADVKGWIARNWDALKADHAKAAAQGGAAEARWWGRIAGRATFEVAATVVPVTKFATVAQAGRALQNALKAGKVAEAFADAARAGKLAPLFGAAVKLGATAEVLAEARRVGRLSELVNAARTSATGIDDLTRAGGLDLRDVAALQGSGALSVADADKVRRVIASAKLDELLEVAPLAKSEVDNLARAIAADFEGRVASAPIKSKTRALEKVMADYGGDAARIKDLARNTIIVAERNIPAVIARLEAAGAKVKVVRAAADPLGYSGVNAIIVTRSGLTAEIQVNTAKMIFAKESAGNARAILGDEVYDRIARETGVEGGRGHKLYEAWRSLPPDSPEAQAIARESRAYYERFR